MGFTLGQQRCIETLDRPLVVAAGAGSGKTFTLTKRIVGALQGGFVSDIDEICAITFTNKAAAELKSRIKGELRSCGLIDQALKVDEAWVSTIHGMCARILRAHALELGIDASFAVAEGAQVGELLSRAVDTVLAEAQADGSSSRVDALFDEYPARSSGGWGVSIEGMLKSLVGAASSHAEGADAFVMPGVTVEPAIAVEQVVDVVEGLLVAASGEKESVRRDEWIAATEQLVDEARAAIQGGFTSHRDALEVIAPFKLAKTFGGKHYKEQVDETKGAIGALVMEVRLGAARAHLETLVDLARRAIDVFNGLKRSEGVLDNNDLLVLAARAIEEHPDIASCYTDKFKLVMVDEFQDTDQMQVDMIKRLSGAGAARLCTVGDAQQSIYRFRGADVSVYRRHLESVRASWPDSVIELSDNFRSHADVLSFVDCVFGKPDMFGGEFMSLAAGRDEGKAGISFDESSFRITVQHTSRPWRGVSSHAACQVAAHRIAHEFAKLKEAGHSAGDMVILLGRMANADVYAAALREAGLACVISGGSVFARTGEAKTSAALVRALANPYESEALFNVLTSDLFGLSAGDLLDVGGLGGFYRAASSPSVDAGFSPQLNCALRVMRMAWKAIGRESVARVVERVVADSGWLSRLETEGPEGLARAANMFKAIRMIKGVENAGASGPASVMRRFEGALSSAKEAPGALAVSGGDSVRIMTIHASKGLEFPIVAVAEVKENRAPSSRLLMASVGGREYLSLDLGRTVDNLGDSIDSSTMACMRDYVLGEVAGEDELARVVGEDAGALHRRLAIRQLVAAGDEEEAKRLLYVAITRAREALVLSSMGTHGKSNPLGVPRSAMAGVFTALGIEGAEISEGRTLCGFGGGKPALVECVALSPEDGLSAAPHDDETPVHVEPFAVPLPDRIGQCPRHEAYRPLHENVFSYSSIADASSGGQVLDLLAASFASGVEGGSECGDGEGHLNDPPLQGAFPAVSFEGESADFDVSSAFDHDRATSLGTAFHRLAQFAVIARKGNGFLAMPPVDRVDALARSCRLDGDQMFRLDAALQRWFASDVARDMAALPVLNAEVPFFVSIGEGFLEGEIDLLGFDDAHTRAYVVDYKTGGSDDEEAASLIKKHALQAACYAYAILRQGLECVDISFVRVERASAESPGQPQRVLYHFEARDADKLEQAILKKRACSPPHP